jgi:hypothetical protein
MEIQWLDIFIFDKFVINTVVRMGFKFRINLGGNQENQFCGSAGAAVPTKKSSYAGYLPQYRK